MSGSTLPTYDETPYHSYPFSQSHPDRLATIAVLLGLQPPDIRTARVLELGCASGGNLIPLAESLPAGRFVGVDLSDRHVQDANSAVRELGLANIRFLHASIANLPRDLGIFDYILCHGVFSWVPREIQEAILDVSHAHLAPTGVAYVSYNTLPGWNFRKTIRDLMLFGSEGQTTPKERAEQSVAVLDFMAQSAGHEQTPYGAFLRSELESIRGQEAWYLLHDHLEENNDPCYLNEFVRRAAKHKLRYLGEADFPAMVPANLPPEIRQVLDRVSHDQVRLEQYMDFLRNRTFRQTLLVHAASEPNYSVQSNRLMGLWIAASFRPRASQPVLNSHQSEEFQGLAGVNVSTRDPIVKAALTILSEVWPEAIPFRRLCSLARERLGGFVHDSKTVLTDQELLGQTLLQFYAAAGERGIELHQYPPTACRSVPERPVARSLARWQAARGSVVTNLRHQTVPLAEFDRHVLFRLDAKHEVRQIVTELMELVQKGELTVQRDGDRVSETAHVEQVLLKATQEKIQEFAQKSLLIPQPTSAE